MMADLLRQEIATAATSIVVKVGTRVLTRENGILNEERISQLAEEIHQVMQTGRKVALVSSGAVGAGMGRLGLSKRPTDVCHLQAVAAVGQSLLVEAYERSLRAFGRHAAQVLLTADDLDNRISYLNARNTLLMLMNEYGAVPIINENDTISVEELQTTFGDNDRLAAIVTNLIQAPLLVLLSDVEGLYDGDPRDANALLVRTVDRLDESVFNLVRDSATGLSKGGMASKLRAAKQATAAGENVIITSGRTPGTLAQHRGRGTGRDPRAGSGAVRDGAQALDRIHGTAPRAPGAGRWAPGGCGAPGPQPACRGNRQGGRPVQQGRRRGVVRHLGKGICPGVDQLRFGRYAAHSRTKDAGDCRRAGPLPPR